MPPQTHTALLLIDNQLGFNHPTHWGPSRSNPAYEANLTRLLSAFRTHRPAPLIIHIAHHSLSANSPLSPTNPSNGTAFSPLSTPLPHEPILTKTVNSAFINTSLETLLRSHAIRTLYIAGLSTDHCVSTTARMAANLGVTDWVDRGDEARKGDVVVVGDVTAAWRKPGGSWDAETVQAVHLESLEEFARVVGVGEVVEELEAERVEREGEE